MPDAAPLRRLDVPHGIERVLELDEHSDCGKQQGADAEHCRQGPFHRFARSKEHRVDSLCSGTAEQILQVSLNFTTDGFLPKREARNRNGDDNEGPKGKHRVIRERCAQLCRLVIGPTRCRVLEKGPHCNASERPDCSISGAKVA
jgi:hypothetical protein